MKYWFELFYGLILICVVAVFARGVYVNDLWVIGFSTFGIFALIVFPPMTVDKLKRK